MRLTVKSIAVAALVVAATGPSYAEPLRSTSIPSSLANDEKRLLPAIMNEFYGSFDKEKNTTSFDKEKNTSSFDKEENGCWISTHEDTFLNEANRTYCMKPIRLDVIKSNGRKMLFVVAGGQRLNEEGTPERDHAHNGVIGLIVLTPNGANLGVVATNGLYDEFRNYGRYPRHDSITVRQLGPNGAYGWVEAEDVWIAGHGGPEVRGVGVYGVIGNSVKGLTWITSYYSDSGTAEEIREKETTLSTKYAFDLHSSASLFYPIMLQVSGIRKGRPFRGNYRLVFDYKSLTYVTPENMPDEINW
jgi:hypothetical protein